MQASRVPEVPLSELGRIVTGRTPPSEVNGYFGDGCPFITPTDMEGQKYIRKTERELTPDGRALLARCVVPARSVTVSCIGWQLGKVALTDREAATNQQLNTIVPNSRVDPDYLYYALSVRRDELKRLGQVGTRTPIVNKSVFSGLRVPLPDVTTQRRIATILSAYDDLIENCERRIRVLDEMARALYREWFVLFRYPGHEQASLVESPLGPIPKGWRCEELGATARITMGQSPRSEFYNEKGEGLPFHQGVTNFGARFPEHRVYCTAEARLGEQGDILFSVRAPVGRMNIAPSKIALGRGISAIRHRAGHQGFLWEQLRSRFTEEDMIGNGAIFAAVTKREMETIPTISPSEPIVLLFNTRVEPIHANIAVLDASASSLRRARDLLVPRLLSGHLSVEDAA